MYISWLKHCLDSALIIVVVLVHIRHIQKLIFRSWSCIHGRKSFWYQVEFGVCPRLMSCKNDCQSGKFWCCRLDEVFDEWLWFHFQNFQIICIIIYLLLIFEDFMTRLRAYLAWCHGVNGSVWTGNLLKKLSLLRFDIKFHEKIIFSFTGNVFAFY